MCMVVMISNFVISELIRTDCRVPGFTLSKIDRKKHEREVLAAAAASVIDKDTEHSIKSHQEARSASYQRLGGRPAKPTPTNLSRLKQLWALGRHDNANADAAVLLHLRSLPQVCQHGWRECVRTVTGFVQA